MTQDERVRFLIDILLEEMPRFRAEAEKTPDTPEADTPEADTPEAQRFLLRSLMNVRPPIPLREDFLAEQDILLQEETEARGVVEIDTLPTVAKDSRIVLWQGDITRLAVDAIVNAANSALLGCFVPGHRCIDNVIHSAAGLQLREACAAIMRKQGHDEPTGNAKITPGFNLPARYVLHTVGPIISPDGKGQYVPTEKDAARLASCYRSCLTLAEGKDLKSVAFCCISTGEFHYPKRKAAEIAIRTVRDWMEKTDGNMTVVFNVFTDEDAAIYRELLEFAR